MRIAFLILLFLLQTACTALNARKPTSPPSSTADACDRATQTQAIPIGPLPVQIKGDGVITNGRILNTMPNETIRISIGQIQENGSIKFGVVGVTQKGSDYKVVLDYVKFRVKSLLLYDSLNCDNNFRATAFYDIGVGLRMEANLHSNEAGLDISNLYGLGLAAQHNQVSGTLTVQTMGITGASITPLLPMPQELSVNAIQNAIQAIATIKAKIFTEAGAGGAASNDLKIRPQLISVAAMNAKAGHLPEIADYLLTNGSPDNNEPFVFVIEPD